MVQWPITDGQEEVEVAHRAVEAQVKDKIDIANHSMDDLPYEHESLDMIWSEGAIYNIGFERGILPTIVPYRKHVGQLNRVPNISVPLWLIRKRTNSIKASRPTGGCV